MDPFFYFFGTGGGLVQERRLAKDGKYNICIHVDGSWKTITVDDRIPCLRGKGMMTVKREVREVNTTSPLQSPPPLQNLIPAFGRSSTKNELWVSLLEKAIAKHYGSYEAITGGLIHVAMSLLTGGIGQMVRYFIKCIYSLYFTINCCLLNYGTNSIENNLSYFSTFLFFSRFI